MSALLELAERCEQAKGPDRDLDGEIHKAVFGTSMATFPGGKVGGPFFVSRNGNGLGAPYSFTNRVEDAELALPDEGGWPEWQITRRYCTGYHANVANGLDGVGCDTPALALCAAALRARAASGIDARQRPDRETGLDPKGESPVANGETPRG